MVDRGGAAAVFELLRRHSEYRSACLNLIASENVISPMVERALRGDLEGRYADYAGIDPSVRKYRGVRYIAELEELCSQLLKRVFGAPACELRPISGHVAGNAILTGLCGSGDLVLEVGQEGGGHRLAAKLAGARLISLETGFLPFDVGAFNVDLAAASELILKRRPRLVILGSSTFLHPHPVAGLRAACTEVGAVLAYDASHVMGLLAAGRFQQPLSEGADVVFGSTHKTLFGPQGGVIFGSREIVAAAAAGLYPPLVTNHHPFRIPALAVALAEHLEFGAAYAAAVIANARIFASELQRCGLEVAGGETDSHTVLLATRGRSGSDVARALEEQRIITNSSRLPDELGGEGIRFGLQELTRRGGGTEDAREAARLVVAALDGRKVDRLGELSARLQQVAYTWSEA